MIYILFPRNGYIGHMRPLIYLSISNHKVTTNYYLTAWFLGDAWTSKKYCTLALVFLQCHKLLIIIINSSLLSLLPRFHNLFF